MESRPPWDPLLSVADVMTRNVRTLHLQESVATAKRRLLEWGVSGAPMVDTEGHIMGVVSMTDIARFHQTAREGEAAETLVWEIGTPEAVSLDASDSIKKAASVLVENQVHRAVVVQSGRPVGIVTAFDIAAVVART